MNQNTHEQNGRWHLDKRVSVGHLITTLTVVISVVIWSLQMQTKIDINTVRIEQADKAVGEVRQELRGQYTEIIRRLERLDQKIDDQERPEQR